MSDEEKYLKSLQKAVLALETTRQELNQLKQKQHEPIAIIGMGCRFPGGADTPDKFWKMLAEGKDGITAVPDSRWAISDYYDPDPAANGKMYTRKGGFLTDPIDQVDAQFFHISAAEAEMIDPQQRLLLEVTWEALENAGINPQSLKESQTGVFLGIVNHDFWDLLNQQAAESSSAYEATGNLTSITAGRLSYFFGLRGPSCAVDTACSSSLVALHLACQSLRSGESDLALAGGVNVMLNPEVFVSFCKAHMLSQDGYCKTFDAAADGYARGEGCGIIVLKRLSDALADQDSILALVKGTSTNQDGASSGLTVPNSAAQIELLRKAWQFAGIEAGQISYFEAHGTGTSLGDPIEINAIQKAMEQDPKRKNPLWISSVKTNIGHLESAAGVAGIIKIITCLQHRAIPPHLHFHQLNPLIDLGGIPARIPLRLESWEQEGPRVAAISSFGIGGTNAHAVIEEAPTTIPQAVEKRGLYLFVLSAKSEKALRELIDRYIEFIPTSDVSLEDIIYTTNTGRAHFDYRIGCVVESKDDLVSQLQKAKDNISHFTSAPKYESKPLEQMPSGSDKGALKKYLEEINQLYLNGETIDWMTVTGQYKGQKVALPTYPFQRESYWPEELSEQRKTTKFLFKLQWEETSIQPIDRALEGAWLIFTDRKPIPEAFIKHVEKDGGRCIQVTPGDQYRKIDEQHYACNPLAADEFQKILQDIQTPLQGIVYFWGGSFLDIAQLNEAHELSCGGALSLMQCAIHALDNGQVIPTLWFVTEKAQPLEQDVNLVAAPLIGLHRTFIQEYPQLNSCLVDIETADQLIKEIQNGRSDFQPAWRGNKRYIASLIPVEATHQKIEIDPAAIYLITGGLGGLGQIIAKSLIEHGAKHLSIIGRRVADAQTKIKIEALAALGVEVQYHSVDIANPTDVESLLANITSQRPLKGVIHAAGVLEDAVLRNQTWQQFEKVFAPKVSGSWNLHQALTTQNISPDFVIFFSSLSGIIGNPGQANYAAANSFMDSLAHYRHKLGLPALSLDWGAWDTEGMLSANQEVVQLLRSRLPGLTPFNEQTGKTAFEIALGYTGSQAIVSNMQLKNGETFSPYWQQLFKHLLPKELTAKPQGLLEEKLANLSLDKRREALTEYLKQKITQVLALPSDKTIEEHRGFFELGMDSLMSIELKNLLQRDLGPAYPLSDTLIFNYPNPAALTQYLDDLLEHRIIEKERAVQRAYVEEPIAIIGMSCRFPGGANSIDEFWQFLIEGRDGIREVPADRWDNEEYYSPVLDQPGKIITNKGGFLDRIDLFDATFFGISPREAEVMDPQQRLVLETAWEALEAAGYAPLSFKGSSAGVYIGVAASEYQSVITKYGSAEDLNAYIASGNSASAVPGRLSYFLGLQGPSISIDTACSSSLVAIHEACQGIRNGECEVAIAGGVNVLLSPDMMVVLSLAHMLSPEGCCQTFDAKADGYARSEGCGIIVLKSLQKAIQEGDPILAVIKGSSVQQDGSSGGLTVPNGQAQEKLMLQTLENAKVSPADVQYLEAHGTGTSLGDPIEVQAISEVYGQNRITPLILGAIKSNIGHTESAAGIAGVIKVVLSLIHQKIPRNLHFETLNPKINLERIPAQIAIAQLPWPKEEKPRLGAVSSFGFSGTIAHAILEEAPQVLRIPETRALHPFLLSARTEKALNELIDRYIAFIPSSDASIEDIVFTTNTSRTQFDYRIGCMVESKDDLVSHLHHAKDLIHHITTKPKYEPQQLTKIPSGSDKEALRKYFEELIKRYLNGENIAWKALEDQPRQKVVLPTYPFQRERYWPKDLDTSQKRIESLFENKHPLIAHEIQSSVFNGSLFESFISVKSPSFIQDHKIYDYPILAGATYLSALLYAAKEVFKDKNCSLQNIEFIQPLVLQEDQVYHIQTFIQPLEEGKASFTMLSRLKDGQDEWSRHVEGLLCVVEEGEKASPESFEMVKKRCQNEIDVNDLYDFALNVLSLDLGKHFRWIQRLYSNENELLAELREPSNQEKEAYVLYPGLIDSCFQIILSRFMHYQAEESAITIPFRIEDFYYDDSKGMVKWVKVSYNSSHENQAGELDHYNLTLFNADGQQVGHFRDFVAKKAPKEALLKNLFKQESIANLAYEIDWVPQPLSQTRTLSGTWLILSDLELNPLGTSLNSVSSKAILAISSQSYAKHSDQTYHVNLLDKEQLKSLLNEIGPISGIILSWTQETDHLVRSLLSLFQALLEVTPGNTPPIWLVTMGVQAVRSEPMSPVNSPIVGLYLTAMEEYPELHCTHIDFPLHTKTSDTIDILIQELQSSGEEPRVTYRDNIRYVPRLNRFQPRSTPNIYQLDTTSKGSLDNLYLKAIDKVPVLQPKEVAVEVKAAGLNFRDVLNAMGLYPGDPGPLGIECSGIITAIGLEVSSLKVGDPVIGFGQGCFASYITGNEALFVRKPQNLTFAEASGVPVVFSTAYYAFHHLAHLKRGERVLIHAGAGGVGLAAIQIAKDLGAEIYVTAGSENKHAYLRELGIKHIYSSRSLDYADQILHDTGGKGVDVVLNSLSGEGFIEATLRACSSNARFVEIGKRNIWSQEQMTKAKPDMQYFIFALDDMVASNPEASQQLLQEVVEKFNLDSAVRDDKAMQDFESESLLIGGEHSQKVKAPPIKSDYGSKDCVELSSPTAESRFNQTIFHALPMTCYHVSEAQAAFKYLQAAKNIGKVIVILDQPFTIDPQGSYLITGGFGGLGLQVAHWLIENGAKHLVLAGRTIPNTFNAWIEEKRTEGIVIELEKLDVSRFDAVKETIQKFGTLSPELKGVIHAAGILNDGALLSLDWEGFEKVFAPKIAGAWNLHECTLQKPLDCFVLFSSLASVIGSPGQSNYAAANAFLDSFAYYRQRLGLPALSINWGPWAEVGMAAHLTERHLTLGLKALTPEEGIKGLELATNQHGPQLSIASIKWQILTKHYRQSPFFNNFFSRQVEKRTFSLLDRLTKSDDEQKPMILLEFIGTIVRHVLGLSTHQELNDDQSFSEMGLDSLMAIELRNKIVSEIGIEYKIPATIAFNHPTVASLADYLLKILFPTSISQSDIEEPTIESIKKEISKKIEEMSIDDLDKLIGN